MQDEQMNEVPFLNDSKKKYQRYEEVLNQTQKEISTKHSLAVLNKNDIDAKTKLKNYISHFLLNQNLSVKDLTEEELIEKIFSDMMQYGFLTYYLNDENVEEININSWDQIIVMYNNGEIKTIEEKFINPKHAQDVITRLLRESNMQIDGANPSVVGHLSNFIRVTANIPPVIDQEKGVSASIRIINPKKLRKHDFIENETLTEEMFDFLTDALRHKQSVLIAGDTGSGKTTILGGLLYEIDDLRIITIEQDMREFDLDKYDETGNRINDVTNLKTRITKKDSTLESINQEKLLERALTMDPDIIVVGEIKNVEAHSAQEASKTGHSVAGTTHASSCKATYDRIAILIMKKYTLDYKTAYKLSTEAFPIIVYCEKITKSKRKVMEITECVIDNDGNADIKTLYKFKIQDYIEDEQGRNIDVVGEFIKVGEISSKLQSNLFYKGMSKRKLQKYVKRVNVDEVNVDEVNVNEVNVNEY